MKQSHKVFADNYVITGDLQSSYKKAFPRANNVQSIFNNGRRLLQNSEIQNYISSINKKAEQNAITKAKDQYNILSVLEKRELLWKIANGELETEDVIVIKGEAKKIKRKPNHSEIIKAIELDSRISGEITLPKNDNELDNKLIKIEGDKIIIVQNFHGLI